MVLLELQKKILFYLELMSRRVGSLDDCTNIHSEQDIIDAGLNINEMNRAGEDKYI